MGIAPHGIYNEEASSPIDDQASRPWRGIFAKQPAGWGRRSRRVLEELSQQANFYVQSLNDRFTNPSGARAPGEMFGYGPMCLPH